MAELTAEEKQRIYLEEKERIEAQDRIRREMAAQSQPQPGNFSQFAPAAPKKTQNPAGAIVVGLVLVFALVRFVSSTSTNTVAPVSPDASFSAPAATGGVSAPTLDATGAQLKRLSEHGAREYDYLTVAGEVQNISGGSLSNVEAVTTYYDKNGAVIDTADALLEYNPIMAGQTSPYKTMHTDNPAIYRFKTTFATLGGGEISTDDAAPPASSDPPPDSVRSSTSDAAPAPLLAFRRRLGLPNNAGIEQYVDVTEAGDSPTAIDITMTPSFSNLPREQRRVTEHHLWNLWHKISQTDEDRVKVSDSHNRRLGVLQHDTFEDFPAGT